MYSEKQISITELQLRPFLKLDGTLPRASSYAS